MNRVITLILLALLSGCGTVQKEYVIETVYISPELPIIETVERPSLYAVEITVNDSGEAVLTVDQLQKLHANEKNLIEHLKFYERQIEIYKVFRQKYNAAR